jgi:hypothetical protein
MPNTIKYSTTGDTLSIKKGNFFFGVGDVGKGPSQTTDNYQGISPPSGGYTIYTNTNGSFTAIFCANDNAQLINFTNGFSNQNFTAATQCLNWYLSQSNFACVNKDYEPIITSGLTLCLDSSFSPSYTTSGSVWYDLSYSVKNATLSGSPTYKPSDKSLSFVPAQSQYGTIPDLGSLTTWTIESLVKFTAPLVVGNTISAVITNQYDGAVNLNFSMGTLNSPTDVLIRVGFFDGSWRITSGFAPLTGVTYYISGTYDGTTIRQYVNGVASGGTLSYEGTPSSGGEVRLMRKWDDVVNTTNLMSGDLTMVRVYNRALSASEILSNYNAQTTISYDPNAVAFIVAAGITNTTQQSAINQLVLDLKSYSLWDKCSAIYPFVGGTATSHKYNLKDPRDLDVAFRIEFYGGWTHNSNGIQGDGVTAYADTFVAMNTSALLNLSNHFSSYNRTLPLTSTSYNGILDTSASGGIGSFGGQWNIQNGILYGLQNFIGGVIPGPLGFLNGTVINESTSRFYINGTLAYEPNDPKSMTLQLNYYLGATNRSSGGVGFRNTTNYAFTSLGGSMTATDASNFYTVVQAFQTTLGRQV